ncbi:MAG: J domain-containing protein [Deltaproteobacteria bacterium]|nr:J domain-containing protein [Deltaproteobacteria bacterium]
MADLPPFQELQWARNRLGLAEVVSLRELRCRYLELAKQQHPDRQPATAATPGSEGMEEINRAYQLLVDYLENLPVSLADDDLRRRDPRAYHAYRFRDWLGSDQV